MSGELHDFLHPGTEAHFDLAPVENATAVEQETLVSVKVDPETRKCGISSNSNESNYKMAQKPLIKVDRKNLLTSDS